MIFLDSNIIIDYLHGDTAIISSLNEYREEQRALFISTITITEVLSLSSATPTEIKIIDDFLNSFILIQPDKHIAKTAATLRRNLNVSLPDALIVASAMVHNIPLATRAQKLRKIPNLDIILI